MSYPLKKLSEISKLIMGQSPSSDTYNSEKRGLPFYQGKKDFGEIFPTPQVWCSEPIRIVEENDILISVRAPVGPTNLCKETSCIGRGLAGIRVQNIELGYMRYYFKKYESEISKLGKGSTFASITKSDLENLQISIPPLPTQKAIVQKLDTAFEKINASIDLAQKNLENVEELGKNVLEEIFSNPEFEKKRLGDLLLTCEYGSSEKSHDYLENSVPVLRMGNIQNGGIILKKLKYTGKDSKTLPKLYLKNEDLLFNRTNSWELVGKTGIYYGKDDEYSFAGYLIRVRFDNKKVLQKFGNYFFNSQFFRKTQIEPQIDQQCGQANFSGGKLKETIFLFPPLKKQKEIVEYLDKVFEKNAKLKELYESKLRDLQEMKQSLLRKAFEGRLVSE